MNIVAIIQARCNSTRLNNKVLAEINGKPLIERVVNRMKHVKAINKLVVATTTSDSDNRIVEWCIKNRIEFFRGSEANVLKRFYQCAVSYNADIVVRVTADDPLKDPEIISNAIALLIENQYDYVSNTIKPTYPEGIDIEVFKFEALEIAYKNARLNSEKEHVTPFIWKNNKQFLLFNFEYKENLSHLRWTIDYFSDLEFVRAIYKKIGKQNERFLMKDILLILEKHPEIANIQEDVIRNEGYKISLIEE